VGARVKVVNYYFTLPRHHAIKIADIERKSLWERQALASKNCKAKWTRAAKSADELVKMIKENRDDQAINYMFKLSDYWWSAAQCGPVQALTKTKI